MGTNYPLNMQDEYRGFVKSLFVESLDYLVISALDGKICMLACYLVKITNSPTHSLTGVPYTLAKLAICYSILHFGY